MGIVVYSTVPRLWAHAMSLFFGLFTAIATCCVANADGASLPVERMTLANGLRVVLAPDSTTPYVAVETWYATGTRDDPPGKQGLAHLFEHLWSPPKRVFTNPANAAARARIVNNNGQTRLDYTRYYTEVRAADIALALSMHADRMDAPDSLLTDALLAQTIDVVINEGRGSASPDGFSATRLSLQRSLPSGHPYAADAATEATLRSITTDDTRAWRNLRSGPENAILLVVGHFDARALRADIDRVFGGIASRATRALVEPRIDAAPTPPRADRVTVLGGGPRAILRWSTPGFGDADGDLIQLAVLAVARGERAHGAPTARLDLYELAGDAQLQLSAANARSLDVSVRAIEKAMQAMASAGPAADDLRWAQRQWKRDLLSKFETLGFQQSRAEVFGEGTLFTDDPEYYRVRMARGEHVTPTDIAGAARRWLAGHGYVLTIAARPSPPPDHAVPVFTDAIAFAPIVPSRVPALREIAMVRGPQLVIGARASAPLVHVSLLVPATDGHHAAALNDVMARALEERLGRASDAQVDHTSNADQFSATLTGEATDLKQMIAAFAALASPAGGAPAMLPPTAATPPSDNDAARGLGLGAGGPWSTPDSATTAAELRAMNDSTASRAIARAISGANVRLFIGGNVAETEVTALVKSAFAGWPARVVNDAPPAPANPTPPGVFIRNARGRSQVRVIAALPLPADISPAVEAVLESDLQDRVNAKLRTERRWSYGAASRITGPRGARVALVWSDVQRDRAADAAVDIEAVFTSYRASSTARDTSALTETLRQRLARSGQTVDGLEQIVRTALDAGVPAGGIDRHLEVLATVRAADIDRARTVADPAQLRLLLVGDPAEIVAEFARLGRPAPTVLP